MAFFELLRAIPGPEFLAIYFWTILITALCTLLLKKGIYVNTTGRVPEPESIDPVKTAVLRGSTTHVIQATVLSLFSRKLITLFDEKEKIVVEPLKGTSLNAIENIVYNSLRGSEQTAESLLLNSELFSEVESEISLIKKRFQKLGILKTAGQRRMEHLLRTVALFLLGVPGVIKLGMGIYFGKPSLFLLGELIVGLIILHRITGINREETPLGVEFLRKQESRFKMLLAANTGESKHAEFLYALFGVSALSAITEYIPFARSFPEHLALHGSASPFFTFGKGGSGSSWGAGCSGGCGSSCSGGCGSSCGGGCGGCGGCGD
jgi:uncharacterized protein (TIGR04222 family)